LFQCDGCPSFVDCAKEYPCLVKISVHFLGFAAIYMLSFLEWRIGIVLKEGKGEIVNYVASQMLT
jgi:hypothetical protein